MTRPRASLALVLTIPFLLAADPTPVERILDVNMPAEAVAALEAEVANADGNKAFLTLLREAYLAELYRLEKSETPNAERAAQVRRSLALLGGVVPKSVAVPATPAVPVLPPPTSDSPVTGAAEAAAAFRKGDYVAAARLFALRCGLRCRLRRRRDRRAEAHRVELGVADGCRTGDRRRQPQGGRCAAEPAEPCRHGRRRRVGQLPGEAFGQPATG
jgi:hypothetical protein